MTGAQVAGLAEDVRAVALSCGLDRVGVCDARPFTETRRLIEERKAAGWSAGMQFTYRNPARATDPSASLAGAQALVVGARSYLRSPPGEAGGGPAGRVARYSWVDHYRPLRAGLGRVAERLEQAGWRARVMVDHNGLVDRAAAVRAGLGWYGKNANVLMPGLGSWFVLGSVITDAPLAAGADPAPVADGCGTCRRCLADCPTGALVGPGQLDARRCLAWLVQAAGTFPAEYRVALGDRLYGCDECQEKCPVNRRGLARLDPPPPEDGAQATLPVLRVLAAGDAELEVLIGRWYIPGRQLRFVRRNALVVLGNVGEATDPAVVEAVGRYLRDADPMLRAHAVWSARRLGLEGLLAALAGDTEPEVVAEMGRPDVPVRGRAGPR